MIDYGFVVSQLFACKLITICLLSLYTPTTQRGGGRARGFSPGETGGESTDEPPRPWEAYRPTRPIERGL